MKNIIALVCMFVIAFMVSGCTKQPNGPTVVRNVEVQLVQVPITVNIPEIECEFTGEGLQPSIKLLDCLVKHKKVLDDIREYNIEAMERYKKIMSQVEHK